MLFYEKALNNEKCCYCKRRQLFDVNYIKLVINSKILVFFWPWERAGMNRVSEMMFMFYTVTFHSLSLRHP